MTANPFQVASQVAGAFGEQRERNTLDDILKQSATSNDPNQQTDLIRQIISRLPPEKRQEGFQFIQQKQQQLAQRKQDQAYQEQGLNPNLPEGINKEIIKGKNNKIPGGSNAKQHVQDAYNRVNEILESGYTGWSPTGLTPEGREQRSELDTLSEVFISNLIPLLNPKGTISKDRFNYIKSLAPTSWDTDAVMKGKLKALSDIFGLEGSQMVVDGRDGSSTVEMRDSQGNIYDIPKDMVENARAGGLQ